MFEVLPFSDQAVVQVSAQILAVDDEVEQSVEDLWQTEQRRRGNDLFDAEVFSVDNFQEHRMSGHFVPYRYLIAQRARPALFAALGVRPLAVSGLLRSRSGVVFGKRHNNLTQDGGLWELAPSGGVSSGCVDANGFVDLVKQLTEELTEELGLLPSAVTSAHSFCMVEDSESHVIDVGIEVFAELDAQEIQAAYANHASREYVEVKVVPEQDISTFVEQLDQTLVPVSRMLLVKRDLLVRDMKKVSHDL